MMINPSAVYHAFRTQRSSRRIRFCSGHALCALILLSVMAFSCVGCGLLLGDPPTYPDQGTEGENRVNDQQEFDQDDMSISGGSGDDEQPSLDQMDDGE